MNESGFHYDIVVVGGGPAGSTTSTLLKKYNPEFRVAVLEREVFPRDHIGESLLPPTSAVLHEMGVWDKVEAANFPIKIGSTNRWGRNPELWDLEFFPSEEFVDEARPAKYAGQRLRTAFQVDRSIYDKILLDHAREVGVEVREGTKVASVRKSDDHVEALVLDSGEEVTAKSYVDASGHCGVLRRAMGVGCDYPTTLQNVAFWDYWQNAEWAVRIGVGGTKIQVMSLGYGWIWFIPLGPTRTSIGLVVPADYYKTTGKRPEDLYLEALSQEDRISALIANATREGKFACTKDWSFLSSRQCGENWFLVGESAGFADPILSAGMTMAHAGGRELAYTILEMERGKQDGKWLREQYQSRQSRRIVSHIRFADFWYTANAQFADIKEFTQQLARDVGLDLSPEKAWQWLAQGGFVDENLSCGIGGFGLGAVKALSEMMTDLPAESRLETCNVFRLNLEGANWENRAVYADAGVRARDCYVRGVKVLPIDGPIEFLVNILQRTSDLEKLFDLIRSGIASQTGDPNERGMLLAKMVHLLDGLIVDGWVDCSLNPNRPVFKIKHSEDSVRWNRDTLHANAGKHSE
jgi:flavin-dependent dehydrogenase